MKRSATRLGALLLATAAPISAQPAEPLSESALEREAGQRIYRQGLLADGKAVRASLGEIELSGARASCSACHRRSGHGGSEGGVFVPPITGPTLATPRKLDRADNFRELYQEVQPKPYFARVRAPRNRPAFDFRSLARLLREGVDPSGRAIGSMMPRYRFNDREITQLASYLASLGAGSDPGVDTSSVHFATIVLPGADPARVEAMLSTQSAYVSFKNADLAGQLRRPGHSLWHRDDFHSSYRSWVVHTWRLEGPPHAWPGQLRERYQQQPVFAILGGLGPGDWRPVHRFCENVEMPCLFPYTNWPTIAETSHYSVYLDGGVHAEAQVVGAFLNRLAARDTARPPRIVQVYRSATAGAAAATTFQESLTDAVPTPASLPLLVGQPPPSQSFWLELVERHSPDFVIAWLSQEDLATIPKSLRQGEHPRWMAAHALLDLDRRSGLGTEVSSALPRSLLLSYRYALPDPPSPRAFRVNAWFRSRRVPRTHDLLQLSTYLGLSLADYSFMHLVENYSRELFLENLEHEAENALNPGLYPHFALGPGQRFASKGGQLVQVLPDGDLEPVTPWMVP